MNHTRTASDFPLSSAQLKLDPWYSSKRLGGLSRFAIAITVLNILGHTYLGFEQSWATPFVVLITAYAFEFLFETIDATISRRKLRFRGCGMVGIIRFLLPAHVSALAIGMLLFSPSGLGPIIFAVVLAVGSKYMFRIHWTQEFNGQLQSRHFLNPSNFAITATLLLFYETVGIAPPYMFTANTSGLFDWVFPLVIVTLGSYLNIKATGRITLIVSWLLAFLIQAVLRSVYHDAPILSGLMPMTGFAFLLFTFYMITDPATTPTEKPMQVLFGTSVALGYAVFMELNLVFGLFYSLTLVSILRAAFIATKQIIGERMVASWDGVLDE